MMDGNNSELTEKRQPRGACHVPSNALLLRTYVGPRDATTDWVDAKCWRCCSG